MEAQFPRRRPAEVLHNGRTSHMHGELISDPDTVHRVAASYGAKKAKQTMGMKFRAAATLGIPATRLTPAP